ncbi:MAG: coproporphyrinogen oxidase [Bacillales bacterium]|jgi:oxygen-independent coproporphyrinogen-3 oxidase|nr:coproporphyrinogen oxidase [Bacillales bacterium]
MLLESLEIKMSRSVYIHIPFCTNICHYCDFNKFFIKNQPVDQYLDALEVEMKLYGRIQAKTLFIGGGTPSALSETQLEKLMSIIHENIEIDEEAEFAVEANPGDLTKEKLRILKRGGVNRLSLGVQTFDDELLEKIGRSHRSIDVFETIEAAKKAGFTNISIDLIYGLPDQTQDQVKKDVETAAKLDLQHISAYSLIIEPKTVFYQLHDRGKLELPTEDTEAEMYEWIMDELPKFGFEQYEISNYAKQGFESRHNLTYWNNEEYFGFGAGAHGYLHGKRYSNFTVLKKYIQNLKIGNRPLLTETELSKQEKMEEEMFLGLRKNHGVSMNLFEEKYIIMLRNVFPTVIDDLLKKELIIIENEFLRLTRKGRMLGNDVFQAFLE